MRHEKTRHEAGLVSATEARRRFDVPAFVTSRSRGLDQPDDPQATLMDAEAGARAKGWIQRAGELDDQWYDVVTALAYGQSFGYLYLTAPEEPETRAMVTVHEGLAFRLVLRGERVWVDEVRPPAAEQVLVSCLPEVAAASGAGATVPTAALTAAGAEAVRRQAEQGDWIAYELGRAGIPAVEARTVGRLCQVGDSVTGQFNVGVREPGGARRLWPFAIVTHHSPSGRVVQVPRLPRGEQTRVEPGGAAVITKALRAYLDELRRQVRDRG